MAQFDQYCQQKWRLQVSMVRGATFVHGSVGQIDEGWGESAKSVALTAKKNTS